MTRIIAISLGTIVAIGFVTIAAASEPYVSAMQAISSSATSEFASLGVGKTLVIDLREDVKEVLVGNPKTVSATLRTRRRIYLTGGEVGQTDVYFFGRNGQQIGGLEIEVSTAPKLSPPLLTNSAIGAKSIDIYLGAENVVSVSCSDTKCTSPPPAPKENTTVINTNSSFAGSSGTLNSSGTSTTSIH